MQLSAYVMDCHRHYIALSGIRMMLENYSTLYIQKLAPSIYSYSFYGFFADFYAGKDIFSFVLIVDPYSVLLSVLRPQPPELEETL